MSPEEAEEQSQPAPRRVGHVIFCSLCARITTAAEGGESGRGPEYLQAAFSQHWNQVQRL